MTGNDEIIRSTIVPLAPPEAWARFVTGFADWWPREHCFCGEPALDLVFIDTAAGIWGEVTRDGRTLPWGAVLAARPGAALSLGWQMDATRSPWVAEADPARASIIDIAFEPAGRETRVTLRHHGFARQGEPAASAMRAVMIGLDRWREWLDLYAGSARR